MSLKFIRFAQSREVNIKTEREKEREREREREGG